ncbi:MAG: AGE family epimerase/isomerase [Gammaproteobacteria bacterium]
MKEKLRATASRLQERLLRWLIDDACPLWSTHGVDRIRGGFHERLDGTLPLDEPRRARVQPRQVSALSNAAALGWTGDASELASHGLEYFLARYRRPDGLFRTLIAADGGTIDDRACLYDQAFALLGFADSQRVLGRAGLQFAEEARLLRVLLYSLLKRSGSGFESGLSPGQPLSANAHMHLLEAALAWRALNDDPAWEMLCNEIGNLALSHLIDASSGAVHEHFMPDWSVMPGESGRLIEPGHQFEWAWLLFQWGGTHHAEAWTAALRLIDIGERRGVRDGVAINSLLDDYSIVDGSARLWPQAERLRVAAYAARMTGDGRYWQMTNEAAEALCLYLQPKVRGSWYDRRAPDGRFIEEPAPASGFYHIVGAIKELTAAINAP